jgi:hypothetical protein
VNPRWLKPGDVLAGVAGVLLLVSLFLPWYRQGAGAPGGLDVSAWEAFTVVDVLLALAALAGVALVVATAVRPSPVASLAFAVIATPLGALTTLVVLVRLLDPPGDDRLLELGTGAWLGLVCALGVAAGAWWSLRDERNRGVPPASVEVRPAPQTGPEAA